MKYKIIADSCCDLTAEMKSELNVSLVPLHLMLEDKEFIDDENLSILEYIEEMKKTPTAPRTACPSPEDFIKHFAGDEDNIFIVTLSQELSGTYNSAKVARDIYLENHDKNIYVFSTAATFSAANLFTSIVKDLDLAVILGEKSSGGASAITYTVLPDGAIIINSSNMTFVNHDNNIIEGGIEVDIPYQYPVNWSNILNYIK